VTTELLNLSHTETALDVVCLGFMFLFFVKEKSFIHYLCYLNRVQFDD